MGASHFDRFVRTLHRRLVVVRALECAARGALAGCCVAGGLLPLLIWRGQPPLPPTLGAVLLGALAGLAWGVTRRPNALDAAAEADRQLGLADLLGTALTFPLPQRESDRDSAAVPWIETVLALADAACLRHAPADVILRRLNARAWAGVALAAVLVVSVAGLATQSPTARAAADRRPDPLHVLSGDSPTIPRQSPAPATAQRPQPYATRHPTDDASDPTENTASEDSPHSPSTGASATPRPTTDGGPAGGSARARDPKTAHASPPPPITHPPASPAPATDPSNASPGTGTRASVPSGNPGPAPSGTSSSARAAPPAPPWHTADWPADVARARDAISAGQVPSDYRDMVRLYFDRDR